MAGHRLHAAVGRILAEPGTQNDDSGESRPTAYGVNHRGAGEIEKTHSTQPAATPDPVPLDGVNDGDEHETEDHERGKFDALGYTTRNDGRRRSGKHELEEKLRV